MAERSCEHGSLECDDCRAERYRSISLTPSATPSRKANGGKRPKDKPLYNNWEKGKAKDSRGMPYLSESGAPIGVKKFAEERHKYRDQQTATVQTRSNENG